MTVAVTTEPVDEGSHAIHFNRGVAGSQAYERKFGDRRPREGDRTDPAYTWLSRGLEEALLDFIATATGPGFALRGVGVRVRLPTRARRPEGGRGPRRRRAHHLRPARQARATGQARKVWQVSEPAIEAAGLPARS